MTMRRRTSPEHPNDEALLAYLDGEMSRAQARRILNHLKICWQCRYVLADLESQAEMVCRLLSAQRGSNIDRTAKAKEAFLRWRTSLERGGKSFFRLRRSLLGDFLRVALAQ
jgi:predicted anti-sigma-YlaC factor YlaD